MPAIDGEVERVTVLQRSPTYCVPGLNRNGMADQLRELDLPEEWVHEIVRRKILHDQGALTKFAVDEPEFAKAALIDEVRKQLPEGYDVDKHFTPRYRPWQQRLAFVPDGDLFKGINDQFGNEVGDEYLQAVAGRLRHNLPPLDTVARWDGDEFLVVIAADAATAGPPLARIAATINSHPIRTTAGPIPGSVSIGAAVWGVGQELEDVIARSGGALYQAKAAGRSQVVVDDGSVARRATADSGLVVPEAGA